MRQADSCGGVAEFPDSCPSCPNICHRCRRYLEEQDLETPTAATAAAAAGGGIGDAPAAQPAAAAEELPAERLAFALGDGTGRIGVLSVQGRKVRPAAESPLIAVCKVTHCLQRPATWLIGEHQVGEHQEMSNLVVGVPRQRGHLHS